jgi:eukaryotic-like serine/threonine-protein kinase
MENLQLSPGSLFANRFEIVRAAGSSGMGTVYRAVDSYSGDTVALKRLRTTTGTGDEAERFLREAQLLSELHHPSDCATSNLLRRRKGALA